MTSETRWQPIESAPKDYSAFLGCDEYGQQWPCSRGDDGTVIAIGEAQHSMARGADMLCWRPLPSPPPPSFLRERCTPQATHTGEPSQ